MAKDKLQSPKGMSAQKVAAQAYSKLANPSLMAGRTRLKTTHSGYASTQRSIERKNG